MSAQILISGLLAVLTGTAATVCTASAPFDIRNTAKVFGAAQMLGKMVEIAGAILFRSSLPISDIPCAMVFVQKAILIRETCLHDYSIRGLRPRAIRHSKFPAI